MWVSFYSKLYTLNNSKIYTLNSKLKKPPEGGYFVSYQKVYSSVSSSVDT